MNSTVGYLRLMKLAAGFRESKIILAANEFDLFTILYEKQLRADEVAENIHADTRALAMIMDALTAMGFLVKENGLYRNSETAERFLVKGKPGYKGDFLRLMNGLWKNWSNLEETIKTGRADIDADLLNQSQREYNQMYIRAMDNAASERAERVARKLDISKLGAPLVGSVVTINRRIEEVLINPQLSPKDFDVSK